MPFDPSKPADHTPLFAEEMRDQLNALKALIDALPTVTTGRVTADWTSGASSFSDVAGLSFAVASGQNWSAEIVLHTISGSGTVTIKAGSDLVARRT